MGEALRRASAGGSAREAAGQAAQRAWVVVVSKPGQTVRAYQNLKEQAADFGEGFELYCPMKLSANRKCEIIKGPFFPRYVFARIDLRVSAWKRIYNTRGVHGLLGGNLGRPYMVADWVIERIQAQEDEGFIRMGLPEERARAMGFGSGERVRLAGSPLEAVFDELVDDKRAAILVSILGRDSRVTVDISKLRAAVHD